MNNTCGNLSVCHLLLILVCFSGSRGLFSSFSPVTMRARNSQLLLHFIKLNISNNVKFKSCDFKNPTYHMTGEKCCASSQHSSSPSLQSSAFTPSSCHSFSHNFHLLHVCSSRVRTFTVRNQVGKFPQGKPDDWERNQRFRRS